MYKFKITIIMGLVKSFANNATSKTDVTNWLQGIIFG